MIDDRFKIAFCNAINKLSKEVADTLPYEQAEEFAAQCQEIMDGKHDERILKETKDVKDISQRRIDTEYFLEMSNLMLGIRKSFLKHQAARMKLAGFTLKTH